MKPTTEPTRLLNANNNTTATIRGPGLGIFIARLKTDAVFSLTSSRFEDTQTEAGIQILGGLKFFLAPHVAVFTEYKFIDTAEFSFESEEEVNFILPSAREQVRFEGDLSVHQVYMGVAVHF